MKHEHNFQETIKLNILGFTLILFVGGNNALSADLIKNNKVNLINDNPTSININKSLLSEIQNTKWQLDDLKLNFITENTKLNKKTITENKIEIEKDGKTINGSFKILFDKNILIKVENNHLGSYDFMLNNIKIKNDKIICEMKNEKKEMKKINS